MINSKELYEKRNIAAKEIWEDFPETLRHILITMDRSVGEYGAQDAIRYLIEHKVSSSEHSGSSKLDYLRWVDKVFKSMYPMFDYDKFWEKNGEEIKEILSCAEEYLRVLAADYELLSVMSRDELGFYDNSDLVNIAQDMDMLFCIMHWYKGDVDQFEKKLTDIYEATKRNVSYLLQHEYAAELKELDFPWMDDFLPMEFIYWENISWLLHFGAAVEFPEHLIRIYEEYVGFLYDLDVGSNWKVRDEIVMRAEKDLQFLYELDIDRIKDEVSDAEYPDYLEQCEQKVQESKGRVESIRRLHDARRYTPESERDNEADSDWERKWEDACRVLREEIGKISYSTWIEPLSIQHVDNRNGILYLKGPKQEKLIEHINEHYLRQIETAVTMFAPDLEKVVILPCDPKLENKHYHKMWGNFTNELRSLMLEYPTMPVVVFNEPEYGRAELYNADVTRTEVVEGCAHDPETGEFTEKIIAVYVNRPKKIEGDLFITDEDKIPF